MRGVDDQSVWPFSSSSTFPITLEHSSHRTSPIVLIAVLLPLAAALLIPFALVAGHLASDAATRAILASRPQAALQIAIALAFFVTLLGWPLVRFTRSLTQTRSIVVGPTTVTVTERNLLANRTWSEPLASYLGVAHGIRTSLSIVRHELTLVHPDPDRSVLLAVANRLTQDDVDRAANFLGLAEIPSRDTHSLLNTRGLLGPAAPQPRLGLARA
jgi:hypothetical protein